MKSRLVIALVFVLGIGTSGYYTQTASAKTMHPTLGCCGGDPGTPRPTDPGPEPQAPSPVPLPQPPTD